MATRLTPVPVEEKGMDDNELASFLAAHEARSIGYHTSEIAEEQAKALNYYYGVMDDLPAVDGGSKVVDSIVAIMIDNGMAAILKPFVSTDQIVAFEPRGPEDVEQAEQATEYINYIIQCDNPGFLIFHDWFKDALLTKIGVVKCWWEDTSENKVKPMLADALGVMQARQDEGYLDETENEDGTFTVTMQEMEQDGRVKIVNIPPEEFLVSPFARSLEEAPYVAHRPSNVTRSDLVEMGVPFEIVDDLPAHSDNTTEESRSQARYRDEEWYSSTRDAIGADRSLDIISVLDEYAKIDFNGDGIAELRRVIRVHDTILFNEEVEDLPFAQICPVPMPHKVYGRSVADQSMPGQKIRTAIMRQTLDNLYKTNNPRPEIPEPAIGKSTLEDIQDTSPGAAIRTKVGGQLKWQEVPFTANHSFTMLEAVARDVEEQTGIQRTGNGFNADALKKNSPDTATQAAIDENARNERAEMIARIFAETGVKRLFKLILKLVVAHQPKARMIRLRNQFVEMDPSGWDPEMDLTISVGLGMGNKSEQLAQASTVLDAMERLGQTNYAYLMNGEKVRNALKRLYIASGIKNVDDYLAEIQKDEQGNPVEPPPPPDPKMAEAQAKMQVEQAKLQAKAQADAASQQQRQADAQAKFALEQEKQRATFMLEQQRMATEAQLAQQKQAMDQALAQQKADFEAQLALMESRMELQLERERMAMQREAMGEKHAMEREDRKEQAKAAAEDKTPISKNRRGGKLDK